MSVVVFPDGVAVPVEQEIAQAWPFCFVKRPPVAVSVLHVLFGDAGELFHGLVPMEDVVLPVDEEHGDRRPVNHGMQFPFAVGQPVFRQLAAGDVLIDADGLDGCPVLVPDKAVSDDDMPHLAVAPEYSMLQGYFEIGIVGFANFFHRFVDHPDVGRMQEFTSVHLGGHVHAAFLFDGSPVQCVKPRRRK